MNFEKPNGRQSVFCCVAGGFNDATDLYQLAKDPSVGSAAGWPVHTSEENSWEILETVLMAPETYAVVLKQTGQPVGSVGLMLGSQSILELEDNQAEIGYWVGRPFWGKGYIPEAVCELLHFGFEDLGLQAVWWACYEENQKSRRVQQKCGFVDHHKLRQKEWPLNGVAKTQLVTVMTRKHWENTKRRARIQKTTAGKTALE